MKFGTTGAVVPIFIVQGLRAKTPRAPPCAGAAHPCTRMLRSWTWGRKGGALSASPFERIAVARFSFHRAPPRSFQADRQSPDWALRGCLFRRVLVLRSWMKETWPKRPNPFHCPGPAGENPSGSAVLLRRVFALRPWMKFGTTGAVIPIFIVQGLQAKTPRAPPYAGAAHPCTRMLRSWTLGRKGVALSASPFAAHRFRSLFFWSGMCPVIGVSLLDLAVIAKMRGFSWADRPCA